jgi:hypothetical protein
MHKGYCIFEIAVLGILLLCTMNLSAQSTPLSPTLMFRLDYHYGKINPWLFYEVPLSNSVGFLSVIQASDQGFAEVDLGPNFHLGNLQLITQVGAVFTESQNRGSQLGQIVPQLYVLYYGPQMAFESWNLYFNSLVDDQISMGYLRDHITFNVLRGIFIGPQFETTLIDGQEPDNYWGARFDFDVKVGSLGLFYGQNFDTNVNLLRLTFLKVL